MIKFSFITIIACSLIARSLHAETSVIVTLTSISDRIRAQNPDLAAARLRIQEALGRSKKSGRLKNPELETAFEHNTNSGEGKFEIGFSQRFPVTGRLRLEKDVSLIELKSSQAEVREVERLIVAKARELAVNILATRQRRELMNEQTALSEKFAEFLSQIAAKGEGSAIDAGQARLEAASLAMETRRLEAEENSLLGELKPLLGMHTGEGLHVSGFLTEPKVLTVEHSPSKRPDYQKARLDAEAAAQNVTLEQANRYEEMEAGVFAGGERTDDAPEGTSNDSFIGVRFKIPLPLWSKNEGAIQEAEATRNRLSSEAIALSRNIQLEAEAARAEMLEWEKMIRELTQTLLPLADAQYSLAETTYRNGQGEIQSVLQSRGKRLELAAARLDALRSFHLARIRYESALGKN